MISEAEVPAQLPVLPLGEVLLPGSTLVVQLDAANATAIDRARHGLVVTSAQRRPALKGLTAEDVHLVGTLARVLDDGPGASGRQVTLEGLARCRIEAAKDSDPRLGEAVVMLLRDEDSSDVGPRLQRLRDLVPEVLGTAAPPRLSELSEPGRFADVLAAAVPLPLSVRQQLLEATRVGYRLSLLEAILRGLLGAAPEPGTELGLCPVHQQQAKATCKRCGAFVCDVCKGQRFDPELCPACEQRDEEAKARKKQVEESLGAPQWMVELLGIAGLGIGIVTFGRGFQLPTYAAAATIGLICAGSARFLARKSSKVLFAGPSLSWLAIGLNAFRLLTMVPWLLAALGPRQ